MATVLGSWVQSLAIGAWSGGQQCRHLLGAGERIRMFRCHSRPGRRLCFRQSSQRKSHRDFLAVAGPRPKQSSVCVTKLVSSVQRIFRAGLHLFFVLTGDFGGSPGPRLLPPETLFWKPFLVRSAYPVPAFHGLRDSIVLTELCSFSPL